MADLDDHLAPLTDALRQGQFLRLVARPGWVTAEKPAAPGLQSIDVAWDADQHGAALRALAAPHVTQAGTVARACGNCVVCESPPVAVYRSDDLCREGWLSPLAARLLSATLALGRNILLTGPFAPCAQLIATLVGEGARPAMLTEVPQALPARWAQVGNAEAALAMGADRLAAWSLPPPALVQAVGRLSGLMGWLDAQRLDRLLVRFEAAAEMLVGRGSTPLHVLAGLDLVVVVQHAEAGPRVREIAEIMLVAEGYRPQLLFAAGLPPAPQALQPLAAPSYVEALAHAGHTVLADELRALSAGREPPEEPAPRAAEAVPRASEAAPRRARPARTPLMPGRRGPPESPSVAPIIEGPSAGDGFMPGWELDRLGTDAPETSVGNTSAEDAAMAATYGLAPPPRPPGKTSSSFAATLQAVGVHEGTLDEVADASDDPGVPSGTDSDDDATNGP